MKTLGCHTQCDLETPCSVVTPCRVVYGKGGRRRKPCCFVFRWKYVSLSSYLNGVALAHKSLLLLLYGFLRNTWLTHSVIGWCFLFSFTKNSTLLSCVCFLHWWIWKYLQSSERAGGCLSHAAVCHPSDTLPLAHTDTLRGRLAQWYVYWEALDNRKGGGCCRNVTTIDKGAGKKREKQTWNLIFRHSHTNHLSTAYTIMYSRSRIKLTAMHKTGR